MMNHSSTIIKWGSEELTSHGYEITAAPSIVVETPWSTVVRFATSKGGFYLKQTPTDLFIESEIIGAIQNTTSHSYAPKILCENPALNCFIMNSCGDYSLRTKFNGIIDDKLLVQGITSYVNILRSFENNIGALKAIDIPDWRLNRIPKLYLELLDEKDMLLQEGLTVDEIEQLVSLVPKIESLCHVLAENKIKETLVNGDFNENNLIIDEQTQQISIIDWGESIIAHPFFSIASHLQSCARRYKLELNEGILEKIKQQCLSSWLDVVSIDELNSIYLQILKLHPIFCVLALYRLQVATQNKSKEMQNWFIAGFLKALLKQV